MISIPILTSQRQTKGESGVSERTEYYTTAKVQDIRVIIILTLEDIDKPDHLKTIYDFKITELYRRQTIKKNLDRYMFFGLSKLWIF